MFTSAINMLAYFSSKKIPIITRCRIIPFSAEGGATNIEPEISIFRARDESCMEVLVFLLNFFFHIFSERYVFNQSVDLVRNTTLT